MTKHPDTLVRIADHPTDPTVVLLHTPPDLKDRMGRFSPARFSPPHFAYLLSAAMLPQLATWARIERVHLVDDRGVSVAPPARTGNYTPGPECGFCGQPGSANYPPRRCPGCGEPWRPITHAEREDAESRTRCGSCGANVTGRFPYCSRCGEPMEYGAAAAARAAAADDGPVTLGDVLRDMQSAGELPAPDAGREDMTP